MAIYLRQLITRSFSLRWGSAAAAADVCCVMVTHTRFGVLIDHNTAQRCAHIILVMPERTHTSPAIINLRTHWIVWNSVWGCGTVWRSNFYRDLPICMAVVLLNHEKHSLIGRVPCTTAPGPTVKKLCVEWVNNYIIPRTWNDRPVYYVCMFFLYVSRFRLMAAIRKCGTLLSQLLTLQICSLHAWPTWHNIACSISCA